ncbi:hypothetical protein DNHGIG_05710 [Collibacillus ludicampi]|uniref:Type II toxin-antitoxin system PemK/MazF family toxin n=1 Tax=Collibacillus ludicampi TaxID=2771369 RepID=A0AAV4LAZ6_9BACL|nr:hypothetical protein DNHGIG_05710 [Collibacillus ludicampi]
MPIINRTDRIKQKLEQDRRNADQGDFFFAQVVDSSNRLIPHPVFVVGKHNDSNDSDDVIVCLCTTHPARSAYDKPVQLKYQTYVRTNKIFVIGRNQLEFKIKHNLSNTQIQELIDSAVKAINLK